MRYGGYAVLLAAAFSAPARAEGSEQVLEILKLHEKLATNPAFQQQAKLLGAYMLEAQGMGHDDRIKVYERVITILREIDGVPRTAPVEARPASPEARPAEPAAPPAPPASDPASVISQSPFTPGAAQLETYRADSLDALPEAPSRRTLWARDLFSMGENDDRELPPSPEGPSAARIWFYFEAKEAGEHAFAAQRQGSHMRILVGGVSILDLKAAERAGRAVVHLEKGFHRIDVLLLHGKETRPAFAVSVFTPGATESHVIPKSDLLLRRPPPVSG